MKKFLMGLLVLCNVSLIYGDYSTDQLRQFYEIIKRLEKSNVPAIRSVAESAERGIKDIVAVGLIARLNEEYGKNLLRGTTGDIDKRVLQYIATWQPEHERTLAEEVLKLDQSRDYKAVKEALAAPAEKSEKVPVPVEGGPVPA